MNRFTKEGVAELSETDYFERPESPACVAILPFVKAEHVGVEIGVFKGDSSKLFRSHCKFMFFIDPCCEYPGNPDKGYYTSEAAFIDEMRNQLDAIDPNGFKFLPLLSSDAVDQIPQVDFVFIDGNHTYPFVREDIANYWPKVKSGGFLCGHDYGHGHEGVTRAVDEFAAREKLTLEVHQHCWLIWKP